ncbi:MAG: phage holin family protein [Oscillospiraceae bacterium]|nr:phage holin family protein [Oscillospiraceae bacterium]
MENLILKFKAVFTAVTGALASWLGILYIPVMMLIAANIVDYATGLCAAKYRDEEIKSYKSVRGIIKKVCMWLLVAVGAMTDWLLKFAAENAGVTIKLHFVAASVVAVWLIANELISILENISDIGVAMPSFLLKLAKSVKKQTEDREEDNEGN